MTRTIWLLTLSLGLAGVAHGAAREVSIKKIMNAKDGLGAGEQTLRVRVKQGEWIASASKSNKKLREVASDKDGRTAFELTAGDFVAHLKKGAISFAVAGQRAAAKPTRLNPEIERYTTNGKIDFSKLHRGRYGGY